ncbi:MAG: ABC transporter permease [Deltaproteobacteria bacterium]|nr:ABC transporter permease [Deltaproteobacteria bacterium]
MKFGNCVQTALFSLWVHKLRSFLTALGLIIGVAAVVLVVALGTGARLKVAREIASVGSNLLLILPGATTTGGLRMGLGTAPTLTVGDARAIAREIPYVKAVAPVWGDVAQVIYGPRNWSTIVRGTTPAYQEVRHIELVSGRFFTAREGRRAAKVAVLGQTVKSRLFGARDPVGAVIRIKKQPFVVIGLMAPKGRTFGGRDQDDVVLVPLETAQRRLFGTRLPGVVKYILVAATGPDTLKPAEEEIDRHEASVKTISWLLWAIASVSLVVGGIGIMNIMLVSVTERTREIGLRMAVGARRRDILMQFLTEAVVLSLAGGLIGMGLGVAAAQILARLMDWPVVTSYLVGLLALLISGAVGVFFGFFPAHQASRLNPIDTLRYE